MTINSTSRTAGPFIGNGLTKAFPFSFKVFAREDVLVAKTVAATSVETILTLDSDYAVSLNADQNANPGGVITMSVAPAAGETLAATSNIPYLQKTDLTNQGGFYPRVISDALDKVTIQIQQLASKVGVGLNVGGAAAAASVMAFISNMAGRAGASLIGFAQDNTAPPRTVEAALRSAFSISYSNYTTDQQLASILAGADATLFVQAAIDALPPGGRLHGSGAVLTVTSVKPKSGVTMSNFGLKAKGGAADFVSPITIDGRVTEKSGIYLFDIDIDGNRINQLAIVSGSEDGGRHGIRMIGKCSNIYFERVSANYCAGDGIEMFSSTSATADDNNYVFNNINLHDCTFNWNRRHGMSCDSAMNLHLSNVRLEHNGLDLNTVDALTSGGRGARQGANLYGNGIDFEGYGLGSALKHVTLDRVFALYNARQGVLFYDALETRGAGFIPRVKIWITDCYFDEGLDVSRSGEALTFTSTITSKALAPLYSAIYVKNTRLDGKLAARNVSNLQIDGEITAQGTYYAVLDHSTGIKLNAAVLGGRQVYADTSDYTELRQFATVPGSPAFGYEAGAAGALSNIVWVLEEDHSNGTYTFYLTADFTPSAAGQSIFRISPPGGATITTPAVVNVINNNDGLPILANHNPDSALVRFVNAGIGVGHKFKILVNVTAT
jgi:hypothetical protein